VAAQESLIGLTNYFVGMHAKVGGEAGVKLG
jgi:hypothetical protein